MHMVPGHPRLQIDDRLCSHIIRSVTKCFGHLDEERNQAVNWSPGGELDQVVWMMLDRLNGPKCVMRVCWECLAQCFVWRVFKSDLQQSFVYFSEERVLTWTMLWPIVQLFSADRYITSVYDICALFHLLLLSELTEWAPSMHLVRPLGDNCYCSHRNNKRPFRNREWKCGRKDGCVLWGTLFTSCRPTFVITHWLRLIASFCVWLHYWVICTL